MCPKLKYQISNYKFSVKIQNLLWKKTLEVLKKCFFQSLKQYGNFLVFKDNFCFTLFQPAKKTGLSHLNVTHLKDKSDILKVAQKIRRYICGELLLSTLKIDNITASSHINREIDLYLFYLQNSDRFTILYKKEKFPGCFIKTASGTALLFHTGKVIVVGCKTAKQIECLLEKISASTWIA